MALRALILLFLTAAAVVEPAPQHVVFTRVLPIPGLVAGWRMDRLFIRSQCRSAVLARPMGTPARRRHLRHTPGWVRAEANHRARQLLRQPEMVGRQPARHRILHDGTRDDGLSQG